MCGLSSHVNKQDIRDSSRAEGEVESHLTHTDLLVVFDPHAQRVDENSDHNPSSKVFAVHDFPERVTHQPPEADHPCRRFAQAALLPSGLPAVSPVPVMEVLACAVAVRVAGRLDAVGAALRFVGQGLGAVRAALGVQSQCGRVHGAAGGAEVTSRKLAGELGCSGERKVREGVHHKEI